ASLGRGARGRRRRRPRTVGAVRPWSVPAVARRLRSPAAHRHGEARPAATSGPQPRPPCAAAPRLLDFALTTPTRGQMAMKFHVHNSAGSRLRVWALVTTEGKVVAVGGIHRSTAEVHAEIREVQRTSGSL